MLRTKKLVAVFMSLIFVFSVGFIPVNASSITRPGNVQLETVLSVITEDYWLQVDRFDGRYFYFFKTSEYVITMDMHPDEGQLNIYHRHPNSLVVAYETIELTALLGDALTRNALDTISVMHETLTQIIGGELTLSNILPTPSLMEISTANELISPFAFDLRVASYLQRRGHTQASNRQIGTLTEGGHTARLLQDVTFGQWNTRIVPLARFTALTVASAMLAIPATKVAIIVFVATTAWGVIEIYRNVDVRIHNIAVMYTNRGIVNGTTTLHMQADYRYDVFVGDRSEAGERLNSWVPANFYNTTWQLRETIARFRNGWW